MASKVVFSGSPILFGVNGSAGKNIVDWVGEISIKFIPFNNKYFDAAVGGGQAGKGESKILLLGHKPITENILISFFGQGQDYVPLLYLFSLSPGASKFQVQTVTF